MAQSMAIMIRKALIASCATLALLDLSLAAPLKRATSAAKITTDFPDPAILRVGDTWYAFGTQSQFDHTNIHVQVASSSDFNTWSLRAGQDALPTLPNWVDNGNPQVWAPDVVEVGESQYVLYFSATTNTAGNGAYHCVGTATSNSITGPYTPNDEPFVCPTELGGAIDASGFVESDGTRYVLYKIDGNARGHGGSCGNAVDPIVSTPILIQQVGADGITKIGAASQIFTNADEDGPLVEAPSLIRDGSGPYLLFYSSGCFVNSSYTAKYATSSSPTSGFQRASNNPLLATGVNGLDGPGGLDAAFDGIHVVFHARSGNNDGRRFMYTGTIDIDGTIVTI